LLTTIVVAFGETEKLELRSATPIVLEFAIVSKIENSVRSYGRSI
jgi:hypothetical protein